jgi:mono/diheme cytochrome c family protein
MLRRLALITVAVLAVVGLAAVVAGVLLLRGGIGSRTEPGRFETAVARSLRSIAIPRDSRRLTNPVPATAEAIEDGLSHFADHCASCHGNDGRGHTAVGRALYPKAPDMREAATQNLSDGELFYIIENGVKFTGMPGWGDGSPESATASWHLVHFIRRLPQLTQADIARMEALNPKSPDEWRQEQERRPPGNDEGGKGNVPARPPHSHKHPH